MRPEEIIGTTLPHSDFGKPECCGCLNGIIRGDRANIVCNECGTIVKTVPATDLRTTLDEMELTQDVASVQCPYCGAVHLASGFSDLYAFVCDKCGSFVDRSPRATERINGEELEWVEFEAGDEPSALTGDLCAFFRGCEKCPGFTKAGTVQPDHPDKNALVFCIHWCHKEAQEA